MNKNQENSDNFILEQNKPTQDTLKKSKSQRKREHLALQTLGKTLIQLNDKKLAKIPVNEQISAEVVAARTFKKGALKRQVQYIGALLSQCTTRDIEAIKIALEKHH